MGRVDGMGPDDVFSSCLLGITRMFIRKATGGQPRGDCAVKHRLLIGEHRIAGSKPEDVEAPLSP
jgi:hypothetical protein